MQNWTVYHYQNWLSLSGRVEEAGNWCGEISTVSGSTN
jgi:hypothetical protein